MAAVAGAVPAANTSAETPSTSRGGTTTKPRRWKSALSLVHRTSLLRRRACSRQTLAPCSSRASWASRKQKSPRRLRRPLLKPMPSRLPSHKASRRRAKPCLLSPKNRSLVSKNNKDRDKRAMRRSSTNQNQSKPEHSRPPTPPRKLPPKNRRLRTRLPRTRRRRLNPIRLRQTLKKRPRKKRRRKRRRRR